MAAAHCVFMCRAAMRALASRGASEFNRGMNSRHDSEHNEWRRRAQTGSRDIAVAVILTAMAVGLIGVAWLGNARQASGVVGPSAEVKQR